MTKIIEVLLVEDDPGDVDLVREAFKEGNVLANIQVVDNGIKAIQYLKKEEMYSTAPRPDLVILDLNLPKKDGREVLSEIKSDSDLKSIPVVVLTTSDTNKDIMKVYCLGGNCYITKPVGFEQFTRVILYIVEFWFKVVKLPS